MCDLKVPCCVLPQLFPNRRRRILIQNSPKLRNNKSAYSPANPDSPDNPGIVSREREEPRSSIDNPNNPMEANTETKTEVREIKVKKFNAFVTYLRDKDVRIGEAKLSFEGS